MFDGARKVQVPRIVLGLLITALLAPAVPASAAPVRKTAPEPAATLLLPFFEQDLSNPNGPTTLLSINNASNQGVLAHVSIWSDLSVPIINFNIYLTGYDVQTINLRDILVNGVLPQTASTGQDPNDTISPKGARSQDVNFPSCNGLLPLPALPASFVQHLQLSLTGKPSPVLNNLCAGRNLGDNIARGYITVDAVNGCTLRFPGDVGYFSAGGKGDASNQNVLWGDYIYVNPATGAAEGNPLVHIVADASDPETSTPGRYTFYGRYVAWSAADNRRPLGTNFASRYLTGGSFSATTSLIVWRDSKVNQSAFACPVAEGSRPSWYRLGQEGTLIFDEQENVVVPADVAVSPQTGGAFTPFPAEAQRVTVGGTSLPVPFNFGWVDLDLNTTVTPAGAVPPADPAVAQAWVAVKMVGSGLFSVGYDAIQLDNAAHAIHQVGSLP
jgi:hypothetical protein